MENKCEICGAQESPDNRLFLIRLAEDDADVSERIVMRCFCEVCIGFGAEMYESYMATKMASMSMSGHCRSRHNKQKS